VRTSRWYSAALGADMRATASRSSDTREVWPASAVTRLYTSTRSPTPLHEVCGTGQHHNMHQITLYHIENLAGNGGTPRHHCQRRHPLVYAAPGR